MKLLSPAESNAKTAKNAKTGRYNSYILHLAPEKLSGYNTCPFASKGCAKACLNTAGRGAFSNVQQARIRKTKLFFEQRAEFLALLVQDLRKVERKSAKLGLKSVVRLNGTSDIPWHRIDLGAAGYVGHTVFSLFPNIQFYDYTPNLGTVQALSKAPIANYHITFSRKEDNFDAVQWVLEHTRVNVAIVFDSAPDKFEGRPVVSGEDNDLRFLDAPSSVVALTAKGKAKRDVTGFVVHGE